MDRVRPGWRERVSRRKSLWHLPKILLTFLLLGILWFALFQAMWDVHVFFYPQHNGHLHQFWNEGIGFRAFASSFILLMPLLFPSIGLSMLITNLILWCIPPARRTFEREAGKIKQMSFRGANKGLVRITFRYLLPIGLGLSLVGALTLSSLK
jgi:hypothetical protein